MDFKRKYIMTNFSTESTKESINTTIDSATENSALICSWIKAQFSYMVFSARRSQGISQAELSRLTGINRTTIVKLEKLQRDPSLDVMIILIKVLKLDFNILDLINSFSYDLSGGKKDDS